MLSSLTLISKVKGHVYVNIADTDQTVLENELKKSRKQFPAYQVPVSLNILSLRFL